MTLGFLHTNVLSCSSTLLSWGGVLLAGVSLTGVAVPLSNQDAGACVAGEMSLVSDPEIIPQDHFAEEPGASVPPGLDLRLETHPSGEEKR